MSDNHIYEMTENDCYPTLMKQQENTMSQYHGKGAGSTIGHPPSNQSKWFRVIVVLVMAILLNFLLIIGVGAALFYYQTKMASEITEINQEINQGFMGGERSNTSVPPGPQGTSNRSLAIATKKTCESRPLYNL